MIIDAVGLKGHDDHSPSETADLTTLPVQTKRAAVLNCETWSRQVKSIYGIDVIDIDGRQQCLDVYRGKVLLIVNVASECGFTPQYRGLEALYRRHKDEGFVVLGFPCNQFGRQEPGPKPTSRSSAATPTT